MGEREREIRNEKISYGTFENELKHNVKHTTWIPASSTIRMDNFEMDDTFEHGEFWFHAEIANIFQYVRLQHGCFCFYISEVWEANGLSRTTILYERI